MTGLVASVRALYEAYPYPHYPLLARPRWQDGYLAHSNFARALANVRPSPTTGQAERILIGGSGEILPYVIRKWEPGSNQVISIDLSITSLRRARFRLLTALGPKQFERGDLDAYLERTPRQSLGHIDAYGVLHHMPNPSQTLGLMAKALAPGGTVRLMVYNSAARSWIWQLQRVLALLKIDRFNAEDLRFARQLLKQAAADAPALGQRLSQLGNETLANDARFADTFLHPREARLSIGHWFKAIEASGLRIAGLFDRYAELDDLPNPLWQPPSAQALHERALDRRFENNLEVYLRVAGNRHPQPAVGSRHPQPAAGGRRGSPWLLPYKLRLPPRLWFSFSETQSISLPLRLKLWHAHLAWIFHRDANPSAGLLQDLPITTAQRLTRIGAILPGQIPDAGQLAALASPMTKSMEIPERLPINTLEGSETESLVRSRCEKQHRTLEMAMKRLALIQA